MGELPSIRLLGKDLNFCIAFENQLKFYNSSSLKLLSVLSANSFSINTLDARMQDNLFAFGSQHAGSVVLSNLQQYESMGSAIPIDTQITSRHAQTTCIKFNQTNPLIAIGYDKLRNYHAFCIYDIFMHENVSWKSCLSEHVTCFEWLSPSIISIGVGSKSLRIYDTSTQSTPIMSLSTKCTRGIAADPFYPHRFASFNEGIVSLWDIRYFTKAVFSLEDQTSIKQVNFSKKKFVYLLIARSNSLSLLTDDKLSLVRFDGSLDTNLSFEKARYSPQSPTANYTSFTEKDHDSFFIVDDRGDFQSFSFPTPLMMSISSNTLAIQGENQLWSYTTTKDTLLTNLMERKGADQLKGFFRGWLDNPNYHEGILSSLSKSDSRTLLSADLDFPYYSSKTREHLTSILSDDILQSCPSQDLIEISASVAILKGQISDAVEILSRSTDFSFLLAAKVLSKQIESFTLLMELKSSFPQSPLFTILYFVKTGDNNGILALKQWKLCLLYILSFIADDEILEYKDYFVKHVDFVNLLALLGKSEAIRLIQDFVNATGDIKTASYITATLSLPHSLPWISAYMDFLDSLQLYEERLEFQKTFKIFPTAHLAQINLNCPNCGCNSNQINKQSFSRCISCQKYLSRCSICNKADDLNEQLFSICFKCGHGGHASHLDEWFSFSSECAIPDCSCPCNSDQT